METAPFQSAWLASAPRSIFLVDDDSDSAFLLKRDLRYAFPKAEIREIPSFAALRVFMLAAPDILVCAYRLHGMTGAEFVLQIRQAGAHFPIVMISSMPHYRAKAFEAGANHFLSFEEVREIGNHLPAAEDARESTNHLDRVAPAPPLL